MTIVWLSANLFGYELLKEALKIKPKTISAIITLAENSKTKMYDGIAGEEWRSLGVPVYEVENINSRARLLKSFKPDLVIVVGWRQVISPGILRLTKNGFVGFHPSLLPEGRGPAPIINTVLSGLKKSGVTMFYLSDGIDDGDIIGRQAFTVEDTDRAEAIYDKATECGRALIRKYLPLLIKHKAPRLTQDNKKATYFKKRTFKDNEIKLSRQSPAEIYDKIRAFSKPYNGAYIRLKNKKLIIWEAELKDNE